MSSRCRHTKPILVLVCPYYRSNKHWMEPVEENNETLVENPSFENYEIRGGNFHKTRLFMKKNS